MFCLNVPVTMVVPGEGFVTNVATVERHPTKNV